MIGFRTFPNEIFSFNEDRFCCIARIITNVLFITLLYRLIYFLKTQFDQSGVNLLASRNCLKINWTPIIVNNQMQLLPPVISTALSFTVVHLLLKLQVELCDRYRLISSLSLDKLISQEILLKSKRIVYQSLNQSQLFQSASVN